jgi:hypothetical protein
MKALLLMRWSMNWEEMRMEEKIPRMLRCDKVAGLTGFWFDLTSLLVG